MSASYKLVAEIDGQVNSITDLDWEALVRTYELFSKNPSKISVYYQQPILIGDAVRDPKGLDLLHAVTYHGIATFGEPGEVGFKEIRTTKLDSLKEWLNQSEINLNKVIILKGGRELNVNQLLNQSGK